MTKKGLSCKYITK